MSSLNDSSDEILEAINQGSYQYAQSQLTKKLKQFPTKSYYWALQYYYLFSTGKFDEALNKSVELKSKVPSDPNTLNVLYDLFIKLGKANYANEIFENAIKKYPNQSIILNWFKKSLENFDIKNLQKSSLQLSKFNKSNELYSSWASFGYFLLTNLPNLSDKEKTLYQTLSLKLIDDSKGLNNQLAYVMTKVYSQQLKFEKTVELIDGLPESEVDLDLTIIYCKSLYNLQNWTLLKEKSSNLLFVDNFNDFDTWCYYIESCNNLSVPKKDVQFDTNSRNSYLAKIHLDTVYNVDLTDSITQYYNKFKSKPCLLIDLQKYINESNKQVLIPLLDIETTNVDVMVNVYKLKKYYSLDSTTDLSTVYNPKDPQTFDLVLEDQIGSIPTSTPNKIIEKIIILEYLHSKDSQNYKIESWLINLYSLINCSSLSLYHYQNLKIKMIQHDTLSYKILPSLHPSMLNHLIEIYKFYLTADLEVQDNLYKAFEQGILNKLQDFLNFGSRISNSASKYLIVLEILKFSRISSSDYYGYFIKLIKSLKNNILAEDFNLSDNRDSTTDIKFTNGLVNFTKEEIGQIYPNMIKNEEYIKLNLLKELIIIENDSDQISKLFKGFNKILSDSKIKSHLTNFENWLFKIYLTFFKIFKLDDTKEQEVSTLINHLSKNLKIDKIKSLYFNNLNHFDWNYNHILINLYDFIKISNKINNSNSRKFNKPLSNLANQLLKDLLNLEKFTSIKSIIDKDSIRVFVKDDKFINDRIEDLDNCLKKSIFTIK